MLTQASYGRVLKDPTLADEKWNTHFIEGAILEISLVPKDTDARVSHGWLGTRTACDVGSNPTSRLGTGGSGDLTMEALQEPES